MGFNGNVSAGKRLHNCGKIHHFLAGKIHYFDWAIFNSELLQLLPGWVVEMGHLTSRTDVSPCSKGCHWFFSRSEPIFFLGKWSFWPWHSMKAARWTSNFCVWFAPFWSPNLGHIRECGWKKHNFQGIWKRGAQNKWIFRKKIWYLVGGLEHFFIFAYIGNNNPNWRTHIFQRGGYTTNQDIFQPQLPASPFG